MQHISQEKEKIEAGKAVLRQNAALHQNEANNRRDGSGLEHERANIKKDHQLFEKCESSIRLEGQQPRNRFVL